MIEDVTPAQEARLAALLDELERLQAEYRRRRADSQVQECSVRASAYAPVIPRTRRGRRSKQ
jgi:hypothetical protein